MRAQKVYRAIGLMSGTSMDGVDVAMIETNGYDHVRPLEFETYAYNEEERDVLRAALKKMECTPEVDEAEKLVTKKHIAALKVFEAKHSEGEKVDIVGFHGHTIFHDPARRFTWQIGDAKKLSQDTGHTVIADLRQADIKSGGQGAPLLPVYHYALSEEIKKPVAILNIGGVSNITWIGDKEEDMIAFDCGPGNALLDDFVMDRTGQPFDEHGVLANEGTVFDKAIAEWMSHPYFDQEPPKSLDRDAWVIGGLSAFSEEDGAANLTAFTVCGIVNAMTHLPEKPLEMYVTGGGRHNLFMMDSLNKALNIPVKSVEHLGWNGDALEAQGMAYLAVRSQIGEYLTLPGTTGVPVPMKGGTLYKG